MERRLPYDVEAEQAVLGACVLAAEACDISLALLTPADFFRPLHQHVFEAIRTLYLAGHPVDVLSVGALTDQHEPRIRELLNEMANATPSVSSAHYANAVLAHSKSRALIALGSEIVAAGYDRHPAADAAAHFAAVLTDSELLSRYANVVLRGFHDDVGTMDSGVSRDDAQPWIARGVLRRGQRLMVVARAGVGKSVLLRQLAYCAESGVHPWTGQPTETPRRALMVELEAGEWDVVDSMRTLLFSVQRALGAHSVAEVPRPAILHRPGGLDLREPEGLAALEAAIQRTQPELVCMGPVKYMSISKANENYEIAALRLMGILNGLIEKHQFGLALEAHFSRGDHGAPGGSERWVDWPDAGFGVHPPDDDITLPFETGGDGTVMAVKAFRIPRDNRVWLPTALVRGKSGELPWMAPDGKDRRERSIYATRWGGTAGELYVRIGRQDPIGDF